MQLISMNPRERAFTADQADYDKLDNIAYYEHMRVWVCWLNPNTKNFAETGGYYTAYNLLQRLKDCYHKLDEVAKSTHLMHDHSLHQQETRSVRSL